MGAQGAWREERRESDTESESDDDDMTEEENKSKDKKRDEAPPPPFTPGARGVLGIYLMLVTGLLAYLVYEFWPTLAAATDGSVPDSILSVFGGEFSVPADVHLILMVMVVGMIGGQVHALRSFADFTGERKLVRSWLWWYLFRPFIGLPMALIVYFLIRGGFLSNSAGPGQISAYGLAAVAALSGMFSDMAAGFLRKVAKEVFQVGTKRSDAREVQVETKRTDVGPEGDGPGGEAGGGS